MYSSHSIVSVTCLRLSSRWISLQSGSTSPMTLFGTDRSEQYRFQRAVGHLSRQRPAQPRACQPFQRQPDSRWRNTYAAGNLIEPDPGGSQTKHFAHSAHRQPLCWHPLPRVNPKGRTLIGPAEAPPNRARSSRNGGRNHLGTPSDIKSECWATSSRIRERLPPESAGRAEVSRTTWGSCSRVLGLAPGAGAVRADR